MTEENTQETAKAAAAGVKFQEDFNSLPLDKKFANLLQMEVTVINEAVKFVADSSMKAFEKLGEVISDLGKKVETEAKKATEANTPAEEPIDEKEKEHEPEAPKE